MRFKRMLNVVLLAAACSGCASMAPTPAVQCFHEDEKIETEIGYCSAVRVGNMLYVSGDVGAGSMPDAMRRAYSTLQKTLAARGLSFENVVKENVYATDLDAFIQNKDVRRQFYGKNLPAATWVQVSRLFRPSYVVEVELIAVFPQ